VLRLMLMLDVADAPLSVDPNGPSLTPSPPASWAGAVSFGHSQGQIRTVLLVGFPRQFG
jgi:hypothetical protein